MLWHYARYLKPGSDETQIDMPTYGTHPYEHPHACHGLFYCALDLTQHLFSDLSGGGYGLVLQKVLMDWTPCGNQATCKDLATVATTDINLQVLQK